MSRSPGATVGGQAVIEGVMMRAQSAWAVAVRRPDGVIEWRRTDLPRLSSRSRWARIPFFRGVMVLVESMNLGFRALSWSAQRAGEEDEDMTKGKVAATMAVAVIFALALFIGLPVIAAGFLNQYFNDSSFGFVVIDGLIRLMVIVGYMWLISRAKEIQRVFMYHGAEHKTIHAYEAGDPLDIEHIQKYSPRHPRCGTSFLIIVAMVAFFVFLTLAVLPFWLQVVARFVLIPVIAGLSYEFLKLASSTRWLGFVSRPGIWTQRITTKQPTDDQVEVAVASLLGALDGDERAEVEGRGPIAAGALNAVPSDSNT